MSVPRFLFLLLIVGLACASPASAQSGLDPTASIDDVTVTEGDSGTVNATFTVTLSEAPLVAASVGYTTADDSAKQPGDYSSTSGTVNFGPTETQKTITVPVNGDTVDEADETFKVQLNIPVGATIADGEGVGTITDDDPPPSVSVSDAPATEGPGATANFTVTLGAKSEQEVKVNFATSDGTAKQPDDYTSTSGTVTFAPGDTEETVSVPVADDSIDEPAENFTLTLSDPQNATLGDSTGTGTITDNDGQPSVSVLDAPATAEGASGTHAATFRLRLSQPSGNSVTVHFQTANGTALAGSDYIARSGTATFDPGETEIPLPVQVRGDGVLEPNESFRLALSSPTNASIGDAQGQTTILNDDPPNRAPIASFSPNPPRAFVAKAVLLDGRGSSDPEGRPLTYAWDLDGNGNYETPTGSDSQVLTAFCSPGTQTLGLRVSDPGSASDARRRSSATTRTVDVVQATPDNSCDQLAPNLTISRIPRSLRRALRRGLAVRLHCSEACTMATSVGVNRRTGRRVGLQGRRRTLGKASGAITAAGSKRLVMRFSRTARRKLRRTRRVRVTLRFTVKDPALNDVTVRRTIILRR